jgi:hypothetical protein
MDDFERYRREREAAEASTRASLRARASAEREEFDRGCAISAERVDQFVQLMEAHRVPKQGLYLLRQEHLGYRKSKSSYRGKVTVRDATEREYLVYTQTPFSSSTYFGRQPEWRVFETRQFTYVQQGLGWEVIPHRSEDLGEGSYRSYPGTFVADDGTVWSVDSITTDDVPERAARINGEIPPEGSTIVKDLKGGRNTMTFAHNYVDGRPGPNYAALLDYADRVIPR